MSNSACIVARFPGFMKKLTFLNNRFFFLLNILEMASLYWSIIPLRRIFLVKSYLFLTFVISFKLLQSATLTTQRVHCSITAELYVQSVYLLLLQDFLLFWLVESFDFKIKFVTLWEKSKSGRYFLYYTIHVQTCNTVKRILTG